MHTQPHSTFFDLQQLVVDLALIDRKHHLIGHERAENDIEHSFMVALLCWFICSHKKLPLDISRVLRYALAHDFVERYAGDTNTFASQIDRTKKAKLEHQALQKFTKDFATFPDLVAIMRSYEARTDEESLFVWTVDKMQAMILADMDGWRPYAKINISYERFVQKHSEQLANCSPHCKEIFASLLEYCKTTYYDQPLSRDAAKMYNQKH